MILSIIFLSIYDQSEVNHILYDSALAIQLYYIVLCAFTCIFSLSPLSLLLLFTSRLSISSKFNLQFWRPSIRKFSIPILDTRAAVDARR